MIFRSAPVYPSETPLRKVCNVFRMNFLSRLLRDIKGVGCKIEKDWRRGGYGWRVIVDSKSTDEMPPDTDPGDPGDPGDSGDPGGEEEEETCDQNDHPGDGDYGGGGDYDDDHPGDDDAGDGSGDYTGGDHPGTGDCYSTSNYT